MTASTDPIIEQQSWIKGGLSLLGEIPDGLEGGIRQQQAALAFQQALRCGVSAESLEQVLREDVVKRLKQLSAAIKTA